MRLEIIRVRWPAATPCATSECDSARISAAQVSSAGKSAARRMVDASSRTDRRCRLKRSRSETTPAILPLPSTTTTWRMPRCAMTSAASPAVASARSVMAGALITSRIAAESGRCGSTTRPITSCRVKMPIGLPSRIDDRHRADPVLLHRRQRVAERGIGAADDRRAAAAAAESGVDEPALLGRRGRVLRLQAHPREVEQVREAARAEVLEDRRRLEQRVEDGGGKTEAERVLRRAVDAGDAAPGESAPSGNISPAESSHSAAAAPCSPGRSPRTVPCRIT